MTEPFDFAKIAAQWIDEFGDEAPARAQRKADMLSRAGDIAGSKWHETIAFVAQHLLDNASAQEPVARR